MPFAEIFLGVLRKVLSLPPHFPLPSSACCAVFLSMRNEWCICFSDSAEARGRGVQGAPTTICLSGNERTAEAQGQRSAMPSPKLAVSAVRGRKCDHPAGTEEQEKAHLLSLDTWQLNSANLAYFSHHICCLCCSLLHVNQLNDLFLFLCSHTFLISSQNNLLIWTQRHIV